MALIVTRLNATRAGRPVLRDVDLTLEDGQTLILRGPNGAGKSTLLKCLAGLVPATHAVLSLDGIDRAADPEGYGERLAYAGHLDAVKPQLSVAENLGFWAAMFGGRADDAMAAFALEPLAERPAGLCSAGQKRRLGLARLLVAPRRLWLLDEPTVSLDEAATGMLRDAVLAHCAGGGLAVIATHVSLGLPETRVLRLEAPSAGPAQGSDPFLAGAMA